ncbi:BTAD domain-containing putative transcriptional regulator [Nocardiopsis mangrovi]|uniref:BTAD domain-containing putative transcriptional regulator n=1 Tax=Nocardiopsis mangrovi TaxID=1179818 RepID=A0ABV9E0Y0_9ACTN
MEVVDDGLPVPLRGVKQRAALGFLLLHANEVVATSRLLRALWQQTTPPTARKMLQNAVADIRRLLVPGPSGAPTAALLTHAPGYLLHLDADRIDLRRFERLTSRGRSELAAGAWRSAARSLREALGMWRGAALADLVEKGIRWPELAAVQEHRLAAFEDCFDAELACGRHHEIVGDLEALAETEPPRERLHGQLMVALYRSGRQTDALGVYRRTHAALVDDLGIEPGRELRELHRMILDHDPALDLPPGDNGAPPRPLLSLGGGPPDPGSGGRSHAAAALSSDPPPAPTAPQRARVTAVLATAGLNDGTPLDRAEAACRHAVAATRAEIERFGGVVADSVGPMTLGVFGWPGRGAPTGTPAQDDAERAVCAALAIRDRFPAAAADPATPGAHPVRAAVRTAVATGDLLAVPRADAPPRIISGGVIDACLRLLASTAPGGVLVCDTTNEASRQAVVYCSDCAPAGGWEPLGALPEGRCAPGPEGGGERELVVLRGLLERVRRRNRPHLVTLLGEPGSARTTGLMLGLQQSVDALPTVVRCLWGGGPASGADTAPSALASIARAYAGVADTDTREAAEGRLADAVRGLVGAGDLAAWLISHLLPLMVRDDRSPEAYKAMRWFLEEIAAQRPLIVVIEDLDRADDDLLEFIGDLVERVSPVPLLVMAIARPELLRRRPGWGTGRFDATTITLDPADPPDAPAQDHSRETARAARP